LLDWIGEAEGPTAAEAYLVAANRLVAVWPTQAPGEKSKLLKHTLARIDLRPDALQLHVDVDALLNLLSKHDGHDFELSPGKTTDTTLQHVASVTIPLTIRRRGQEARIVIEGSSSQTTQPDEKLVALIGRAHLYSEMLTDGAGLTLASLAEQTGAHIADISRVLPLTFLSPMITKAILTGRQPPGLTAREFVRATEFPLLWSAQADAFGR
jgi:site-specific DNA recombinase